MFLLLLPPPLLLLDIKTRGRRRAATGCCCYRPPTRMNEPTPGALHLFHPCAITFHCPVFREISLAIALCFSDSFRSPHFLLILLPPHIFHFPSISQMRGRYLVSSTSSSSSSSASCRCCRGNRNNHDRLLYRQRAVGAIRPRPITAG